MMARALGLSAVISKLTLDSLILSSVNIKSDPVWSHYGAHTILG